MNLQVGDTLLFHQVRGITGTVTEVADEIIKVTLYTGQIMFHANDIGQYWTKAIDYDEIDRMARSLTIRRRDRWS